MTTEKIISPPFRVSFPHLFVAASVPGTDSEPKFSVSMLFPKSDPAVKKFIRKVEAFIADEIAAKWTSKPPKKLRSCLADGDDEDELDASGGTSEGYYVIKGTSNRKPEVIGLDGSPVGASDVYAGSWCRGSLVFRAYDKGTNGVACHFQNFLKVRDDDAFGATRSSASDEFAEYLGDEDEDLDVDERPAKKSAAKPAAKKRPVEDDDEDDRPAKKSAVKPAAKKRPVEDDEDDDEEELPRRPAKVGTRKSAAKKRPVDEDDEEFDV